MGKMFLALALAWASVAANADVSVRVTALDGWVGERLRACYERAVKGEDVQTLVDVFKKRDAQWDWKSEFWGKWMHSAPVFAAYFNDAAFKARIAAATAELIATQTPEGYIGNYPPERQCPVRCEGWDVWGRKYTLLGLIHQYDYARDDASLRAAMRLLDHLMTQVGPDKVELDDVGNYRGMPSLSILEPVVWLARRVSARDDLGGKAAAARYLAFAKRIVGRMEAGPGLLSKRGVDVADRFPHPLSWWCWDNGGKAYEMMSCYQGLIEYARETGNADCRAAALAAGENIFRTEINVCGSGSSNECWYHGSRRQARPSLDMQEGCVTVTWMRFCEALWRESGEAKWADRFERTFYNAFLGCFRPDGTLFAKYSPLDGCRHPGDHQCGLKTNCCTANGPRGFVEFLNFMAAAADNRLTLNLYAPATLAFELACGRGTLRVETDWPKQDEVTLKYDGTKPLAFTVRLRVPGEGKYRELARLWKPGERVTERFPLKIEREDLDGCLAYRRGPVVFARDARLGTDDVREPVWSPEAEPPVRSVTAPAWARQALEVDLAVGSNHANPEEYRVRQLRLVDYASAGNGWDALSRFRVWMPTAFDPKRPVGDELVRPQLRFTQAKGWANDPNGLVRWNGEWHFFHQHHPDGIEWGAMHWNHAVSTDLVHWRELGDVLYPDALGTMFSGSAVVDRDNTAGFGRNALVLAYTAAGGCVTPQKPFTQCLAYSTDGRNFLKYTGNPVLQCIAGGGNRDPRVFWHEPTKRWVMALYGEREGRHNLIVLTSPNLKDWTEVSAYAGDEVKKGTWLYECPGLEELRIEGETNTAWVVWGAADAYAVGTFDGTRFVPTEERLSGFAHAPKELPFYAAQTFAGETDGRTIWMAWFRLPYRKGALFSQSFSFPQELSLRRTAEGLRLVRRPVRELSGLRDGKAVPLEDFRGELAEINLSCRVRNGGKVAFDLRGVPLVYDDSAGQLTMAGTRVPWRLEADGRLAVTVFLDRVGAEVFSADGLQMAPIPDAFPNANVRTLSVTDAAAATEPSFTSYRLKSSVCSCNASALSSR